MKNLNMFKIFHMVSTLSGLKRVIIDHLKDFHKVKVPINKNPQKSSENKQSLG